MTYYRKTIKMDKYKKNGETMKFNSKINIIAVLILLPFVFGFGQIKEEIPIPISVERMIQIPVQKSMSLNFNWFDADKFSMSHSYSMSAGTFGSNPYSQGMYLNHMNYAFSEKLNIKAVVGFSHDPLKLGNNLPGNGFDLNNMVYGAEIDFKPTKNSIFRFSFQKTPMSQGYGQNPYQYSPYGYNSYYRQPSLFNNNNYFYGF